MRGCGNIYEVNVRTFIFYVMGLLTLFIGVAFFAPVEANAQASPVPCVGPYNQYNRQDSCGYFNNQGLDAGPDLRGGTWNSDGTWTYASGSDPGIPNDVDTAQEFIDMILSDYYTGDQRARTVAKYMILSMIGVLPTQDQPLAEEVTPAQIVEWQARVLSYADIDDNSGGSGVSTGQNGSITWNDFRGLACGDLNTYYQIEYDDVTAYEVTTGNNPDCTTGDALAADHIVFADTGGTEVLQIRRICMNPTGTALAGLADAEPETDGQLGDLVFEDKNKDGVYNESDGDVGIAGVTIALYAANAACQQGDLIATTTTDSGGQYQFTNLPIIGAEGTFANYVVVVTDDDGVLNDFTTSQGKVGQDNNSQDPAGYCMTLALAERSNQTGDFGYYLSAEEELAPTGSPHLFLLVGASVAVLAGGIVLRRFSRHIA